MNFAVPCVVLRAPSRDPLAHARPLQKCAEIRLLRGNGMWMLLHRIRMIAPIIRISRYEGPSCTGVFEKSFKQSILNIEKPPWKSLIHCKRRRKCALITPAPAYKRKYGGICKGFAEKTIGGREYDNRGVYGNARRMANK